MSDQARSESQQTPEPEHLGPVNSVEDLAPDTRALFDQFAAQVHEEGDEAAEQPPAPGVEAAPEAPPVEPASQDKPPADASELSAEPAPASPEDVPSPFTDAFDKLRAREKALDDKRLELKEAEEQIRQYDDLKAGWSSDRVGTLERVIAQMIGSDDPERIKAEYRALYEDSTYSVLDIPPDSDKKALSESARTRRELEAFKRKVAEENAKREEEAAIREHHYKVEQAKTHLNGYVSDAAHEYPNLVKWSKLPGEASPGEILWEVMSEMVANDPDSQPTPKEAADQAERYFKTKLEALLGDHPLLAPDKGEQPAEPSKQSVESSPLSKPVTRTLTNGQVAQTSQPPPEPDFIEDPEEAAQATLARFARQFK